LETRSAGKSAERAVALSGGSFVLYGHLLYTVFMKKKTYRWVVGIDEAGRGPLAGPVAIGAVCIDTHNKQLTAKLKKLFPKVKDSKQLLPAKRDEWMGKIKTLKRDYRVSSAFTLVSAKHIDTYGISLSIKKGVVNVLKKLNTRPGETWVMLDGSLRAPAEFIHQATYIKGDATHLPIALASIVAKTARDAHMIKESKKTPGYGFEVHKGYGTKAHYDAIKRLGVSKIHRKSFLGEGYEGTRIQR
jgi:ribonuclease HII